MFSTVYRLWESTWTSDTGSCHITSHSINMSTLSKRFPGWAPYFIMHPHKHMHRQLVLNHWACQDSCLLFPWILPSCGGPVRQVGTGQKATWKEDTGKIAKIRLLIVGLCTALLIGAMTVRRIMSISVFLGHRESLDFELEAETGLTPPSPPVWAGYVSVGRSLEACTNIWLSSDFKADSCNTT